MTGRIDPRTPSYRVPNDKCARGKKKPITPNEPASCVLMDYGGYSVWMKPEKAKEFAAGLRKRGRRCYIVRRKVKP